MSHYNEYKSKDLERCKEKLKKLYGIEPYNRPDNQLYQDGYFSVSIKQDFDEETIKQAKKELNLI